MAEALARSRRLAGSAGEKPLVVGVMGSGHIRFGYGVPHQLRDLGVKNIGTLLPVRVDARLQGSSRRPGRCRLRAARIGDGKARAAAPRRAARRERRRACASSMSPPGAWPKETGLKGGDQLVEVAGLR